MWGSCFSLGSRRSCSRSRRAASSPHHTTTHHSSTSHTSLITSLITSSSSHHNFSHLTYHISHHIFIITPQNMTAPLLTSHSSHQCGREQRPRGAAVCVAAAGPRLSFVWQAHYAEPFGGAAARVAAAGPRLAVVWQPLRATMACTFSTYFLDIATSKSASNMVYFVCFYLKCASYHNGMHFFDILTAKSDP